MSKTTNKYSPEVRERAVRLVLDNPGQHESRWSAILSISSKITPELSTGVERVSADVFDDQVTGTNFYAAELSLTPDELARLGDQALLPGMPIEAYLKTDERTPLSYLTKPLMDSFYKATRG